MILAGASAARAKHPTAAQAARGARTVSTYSTDDESITCARIVVRTEGVK
jgi:hypothetical protein